MRRQWNTRARSWWMGVVSTNVIATQYQRGAADQNRGRPR
jgi:hypothetical protein